jgi:hypothetical protein
MNNVEFVNILNTSDDLLKDGASFFLWYSESNFHYLYEIRVTFCTLQYNQKAILPPCAPLWGKAASGFLLFRTVGLYWGAWSILKCGSHVRLVPHRPRRLSFIFIGFLWRLSHLLEYVWPILLYQKFLCRVSFLNNACKYQWRSCRLFEFL